MRFTIVVCPRPARLVLACLVGTMACTGHRPSGSTATLRPKPTAAARRVIVVDMTPKFLTFYDSATARQADTDGRWELWQRLYNVAAVPPTPFGRQMARRLLDSAWARYPTALPRIRQGLAGLGVSPDSILGHVSRLLGCGDTLRVGLRLFVGGFEGNAFAYNAPDGTPFVAIPVEAGDPQLSMVHEFAHAVHRSSACAGFPPGYRQSLALLVLSEGVAMRVTERLIPGHPATYYLHGSDEWLASAQARRASILQGVRKHLRQTDEATVQRFTFGAGTSGVSREAYYAGWEVMGALLRMGLSLHDIATTPASEVPELVERAIDHLSRKHDDRDSFGAATRTAGRVARPSK
jgi:hypothetical protein